MAVGYYLVSTIVCLLLFVVGLLLLNGLKLDGDTTAETIFENKYYLASLVLGGFVISFIPLVRILVVGIIIEAVVDYI